MKKIIFLSAILLIFSSCRKNNNSEKIKTNVKNAVIYEVNIRQYSEQGTFEEFTKDIPMLKELGVKIIWAMPIFPISKTKRKATGGDFAYLLEPNSFIPIIIPERFMPEDFPHPCNC